MFGPSVKSVPGWWVSMVPMLIGVPVALTPGLLPHDDVLTEVAALLELVLALLGALEELLLLLELLPQPASATSATAANSTRPNRRRGTRWVVLTDLLLSSECEPGSEIPEARADTNSGGRCMQLLANKALKGRLEPFSGSLGDISACNDPES
jgi:hypothetical protein